MIAENRSWKYSLLLHFALFLVAAFGLPALLPEVPEPQPLVLTVDILPISAMTNVPPSEKPIQEKKAPEKPLPKPREPVKPPPPKEVVKEEVKEKVFDPTEKAEEAEKEKPEEKKEKTFEETLAALNEEAKKTEEKAKDNTAQEENRTQSDAPFDESQPLSMSEEDAIRNAYRECWSFDAGVKDPGSLIVRMQVKYNIDGTVISSELDPKMKGRYNSELPFRAAVEAAKRAILLPSCNPLKNLPPDLYPKLGSRNILFDPSKM